MIKRNRSKQVIVRHVKVLSVYYSGVVQVGDVLGPVYGFAYGEATAGPRGAGSFGTEEIQSAVNSRLHFANQTDENVHDTNIYGEGVVMFRPRILEV